MGYPSLGSSPLSPLGRSGDLVHYCGTYLGSIESAPSPIWDFWNDLMDIDKDGGILALESGLGGISWMTRSLVQMSWFNWNHTITFPPRLATSNENVNWMEEISKRASVRAGWNAGHFVGFAGWKSSLGIENGQTCSDWRYLILFSGIISKWMVSDESTFQCQNATVGLFVLNTNISRIATLKRSAMNLRNVPRTYHIARIWKKGSTQPQAVSQAFSFAIRSIDSGMCHATMD